MGVGDYRVASGEIEGDLDVWLIGLDNDRVATEKV